MVLPARHSRGRRNDRTVLVDLPLMQMVRDAADAVQAVTADVGRGELTPQEGASVAGLIETYRRTLELTEIEERVAELERVMHGAP